MTLIFISFQIPKALIITSKASQLSLCLRVSVPNLTGSSTRSTSRSTSRTNYKTGQSSAECYLLLKADLDWIVFQEHCSECW